MPWALKPKSSLIDKVRQDSALAYIQRKGKMVLLPLDAPGHVEVLFLRPMTTNPQSEIRLMRRPASPTMPPAGRSKGTALPDLAAAESHCRPPVAVLRCIQQQGCGGAYPSRSDSPPVQRSVVLFPLIRPVGEQNSSLTICGHSLVSGSTGEPRSQLIVNEAHRRKIGCEGFEARPPVWGDLGS